MPHTPGPWKAIVHYLGRDSGRSFPISYMRIQGGEYDSTLIGAGNKPIKMYKLTADLQFGTQAHYAADGDIMFYEPTAEARANASLIAACPQLLAACELASQFVAKYAYDNESKIASRTLDKMIAAIAAAKGE